MQKLFSFNLTFTHFKLRISRSLQCLYSSVVVKENQSLVQGNVSQLIHGSFCGRRSKWTLYSLTSRLIVEYVSMHHSKDIDSFSGVYQVIDASLMYRTLLRPNITSIVGKASISVKDFDPVLDSTKIVRFEWLLKSRVGYNMTVKVSELMVSSGKLVFYDGPLPYGNVDNPIILLQFTEVASTAFLSTIVLQASSIAGIGNITLNLYEDWCGYDTSVSINHFEAFYLSWPGNATRKVPLFQSWMINAPKDSYIEMHILHARFESTFTESECEPNGLVFTEHQPNMRSHKYVKRSQFYHRWFPSRVMCTDITASTYLHHTTANSIFIYLYNFDRSILH